MIASYLSPPKPRSKLRGSRRGVDRSGKKRPKEAESSGLGLGPCLAPMGSVPAPEGPAGVRRVRHFFAFLSLRRAGGQT